MSDLFGWLKEVFSDNGYLILKEDSDLWLFTVKETGEDNDVFNIALSPSIGGTGVYMTVFQAEDVKKLRQNNKLKLLSLVNESNSSPTGIVKFYLDEESTLFMSANMLLYQKVSDKDIMMFMNRFLSDRIHGLLNFAGA